MKKLNLQNRKVVSQGIVKSEAGRLTLGKKKNKANVIKDDNEYKNNLLSLWLILCGRESSIVDDEPFKALLRVMDPGFKLSSRQTECRREKRLFGIAFKHMKSRYKEVREWYGCPFLSLEGDGWSSSSNKAVFVVNVKFWDPFRKENVSHR